MKPIALAAVIVGSLGLAALFAADSSPTGPARVRHTDARAAAALVASNAVIVLDVRTPKEFAAGHIAGATNIDFLAGDFQERAAKLGREKTYLVHCASGKRSTNCLPQLGQLGFTNLVHLDGGFTAWRAAGLSVAKP